LVDDDCYSRGNFAQFLGEKGYAVHEANDGAEAQALIETTPFDLVIADLLLPGKLNGIDVLVGYARAQPGRGKILMTAFAFKQLPNVCKYIDAVYLPKPFTLDVLLGTVQSVLPTGKAREA
jgi:DNA-binding NtrC family response regulator